MKTFNDFDRMFRQLERRSGNDPSRIEWLVKNSPEVRRLVGSLYFWEREFQSERAKHPYLQNVPHWFSNQYKSYRGGFGPEVDRAYGWLELLTHGDDDVDGIPASEILHPNGTPSNDSESGDVSGWFPPGDGAEAVEFMIRWLWDMHDGSGYAEDLCTGLDAWEWFTETVGIDLAKIEARWNTLPRTLIPSHLKSTNNPSGPDGLVELLDNATKAYVFGLPAAAVAMCRAICEQTLKEFYFGDDQKEETLGHLVFLAETRYAAVKQLKLRRYIQLANKVMHEHRRDQLSDAELDVVRQFLEVTKALIEQVPQRSNVRS